MKLRAVVAAGLTVGIGAASGVAVAYFDATTSNAGNTFASAPDFVAPESAASALVKSEGGEADFIRPGGGYRAFARVTDTGQPASGVASVTADTGGGPFALTGGDFTADAVSYNHRSAAQTAPAWSAGSRSASFTLTDNAGNARTVNHGFTVDATAPVPTDIQITDGGGQSGAPQAGDVVTFAFSEPIDRESIIAGWITRSGNNLVLTLGTASANGILGGLLAGNMTWTPSTAAFDRAGNRSTAPAVAERGALDVEF